MKTYIIPALGLERSSEIIGKGAAARVLSEVEAVRAVLADRIVWHVNSTRTGGGVAEMLQTQLGYERGAGLDARWIVIDGDREFFTLTKRIHHRLHGQNGDGGPLSDSEHRHYEDVSRRNCERILSVVRPRDVVVLHDPQTAGLAPALRKAGATVVWRSHVGRDRANDAVKSAWRFLERYLVGHAQTFVFSRTQYVPTWLSLPSVFIIPPAIDALSVKNQPMTQATARAILRHVGMLDGRPASADLTYGRLDGSSGRVERRAEIIQIGPVPDWKVPIVTQVSRWDPLKDMFGVMGAFTDQLDRLGDAHLALVGPDVRGVTDDPDGSRVLQDCVAAWRGLPGPAQRRIHLVCLPMHDVEENAAMVNAFQRHAAVVVQKSLHEGFGLTVTEAMLKGRAIIASAVGGIQDQIVDGVHGLLLFDPTDSNAFGTALARLLRDRKLARRLGRNARRRAIAKFLGHRQLIQFAELLGSLEGGAV